MLNIKFGRLLVIKSAPIRPNTRHRFWTCQCDCGNEVIVDGSNLKNNHTRSCGCLCKDVSKYINFKRGRTHSTEFITWASMRQRCRNKNNRAYKDYGERGIKICEKWDTFEAFLSDMGLKPGPKFTLERLDNNGPYSSENDNGSSTSIILSILSREPASHNLRCVQSQLLLERKSPDQGLYLMIGGCQLVQSSIQSSHLH